MTLLVVFMRRVLSHFEMVFASDSRLSNGQRIDFGQKVFQTPRSDALIAFAGDTDYAFPLLMQTMRAIEGYPLSSSRRLPLPKLKRHILRVFQQTYDAIHTLPFDAVHPEPPDNYFLLGGYDWQSQRFRAWRLAFDKNLRLFVYRPILRSGGKKYFFAGDNKRAVSDAVRRTDELLSERGKGNDEIDLEPFEVLSSVISESPKSSTIGGVPQIGKAYQHLNTQLFQVSWPLPEGNDWLHVAGRPLLPGERCLLPVFDPKRGFYASWPDVQQDQEDNGDSPE